MPIRVRYAPSPTGSPHVGNIRDALFKHLLAKHHGGTNILRLEDTDRSRFVEGCEEEIVESLHWVGVEWQEGLGVGGPHAPYRQSERKEAGIYDKWIKVLLDDGHAYKAFETPEELAEMREYQTINKQPVGYYGGVWRDASPAQAEEATREGKPFVIRQKIPRNQTIAIEDVIRGRIEWDSNTVDDPVLIKADGMPTYHFAAMVDDHLMDISHIMRGEEWISSAPKHAVLFDQFGWSRPIFVHCPVIKGKDGSKLSKRHGDTRCLDFRSAGYLPEALVNFIALIGWAPGGDRELMPMPELIEAFSLDGLQPSPGVFDLDKLKWMNANYIRGLSPDELATRTLSFAAHAETKEYWSREAHAPEQVNEGLALMLGADKPFAAQAIELEQPRVETLAQLGPACSFFFENDPPMDPKAIEKWFAEPHAKALFDSVTKWLGGKTSVSVAECEEFVRSLGTDLGLEKLGPIVHPLRVALTGRTVGPGLFELMALLGPERMMHRLNRAKGMLR